MEIEATIKKIVNTLKNVNGIHAVVLGGSRARGNFTEKSDIDIGIYYGDSSQLDLDELSRIATQLDDTHRENIITNIGEWGPWINGGGWLTIEGTATDFLFRDLTKVSAVIEDCLKQNIEIYYQPGHPHGFVNSIYAAETFYCKTLWDSKDYLEKLKVKLNPYPLAIKIGTINKFLWEAEFFSGIADKSLSRKDIVYTTGCLYKVVACLIQIIFALNETFLMNEKGALLITDTFQLIPNDFRGKIEGLFYSFTTEPKNAKNHIDQLMDVVKEVRKLCEAIEKKIYF